MDSDEDSAHEEGIDYDTMSPGILPLTLTLYIIILGGGIMLKLYYNR